MIESDEVRRVGYQVETFGGSEPAATVSQDLADLHSELLAHSPAVLMGRSFLKEFYYRYLPADDLMCGAIAYLGDAPAGFMIGTGQPADFMQQATRRHWLKMTTLMMMSVLRHPGRIGALIEARKIQSNVQAQQYDEGMGELLSFGVLREFRSRRFVREHGIRIADDLMAATIQQLTDLGKTQIRAIVDKDNLEAQLFYRAHGWQVGIRSVQGWRVPTMEFLLTIEQPDRTSAE